MAASRGPDHDVSGEGVLAKHEVERLVQARLGDLPGDEGPRRELVREQRLADAADDAGAQHRLDALDDRGKVDAGARGDLAERVAQEAADAVLGDGEDGGVGGVVDSGGDDVGGHASAPASAATGSRPMWAASCSGLLMRRQVNIGVSRAV